MKKITIKSLKSMSRGDTLIHRNHNNKDGTPVRARCAGKPKTWKTRPNEVVVSMKYGFKDWFKIGFSEHQSIDQNPVNWAHPENGEEYEKR